MNYSNLKDFELVKLFVSGNQSGIETLIKRHKNRVFTYILLIVKNQELAEDIFQETFIKVIKSLKQGRYQEKGIFVSWVVRIAHNLIIDHYRKAKHMKTFSNDEDDEIDIFNSQKFSDENIEDLMIQGQINSNLKSLVSELPDDQREVIMLRYYSELSFKEIAEQTNVSINTALGRMRYALINMRKMMEEKGISLTVK